MNMNTICSVAILMLFSEQIVNQINVFFKFSILNISREKYKFQFVQQIYIHCSMF